MRPPGIMVRCAVKAGWADDGSVLMKSEELNPWMTEKPVHQAKQDDDQRKSIVQQFLLKSTDFLRRIFVPVEGQGGVTQSYVYPSLLPISDFLTTAHDDGIKSKKQCNWWCEGCVGQYQLPGERRCFGRKPRLRVRARISCVLSSCWPMCEKGADNFVVTILEGLLRQGRMNIPNELGKFIDVDNNVAVKIGDSR